ncbi:MAG: prenyltransferase/squalene oxidase repeat-containing protein [Gemmataceae bacterium]
MSQAGYLFRLNAELGKRLGRLKNRSGKIGIPGLDKHAEYLFTRQLASGGFPDREGEPDLYYTAFGLRGMALLGVLDPERAIRAGGWLAGHLNSQATVVDLHALVESCLLVSLAGAPDPLSSASPDWQNRLADLLQTFRTPDGGYGKVPWATSGSTYHSFLVALTHPLMGRQIPDVPGLLAFLAGRERADGGWVEAPAMRKSGANPTAAALGLRQMLDSPLDPGRLDQTAVFLDSLAGTDGGYRANSSIPLSDTLSSFTVAWSLDQHGLADRIRTTTLAKYLEMVALPEGGFRAGVWDAGEDVEYTFYGLGLSALVHGTEGA